MAAAWKNIARTIKPASPMRSALLRILPASFSSRSSNSRHRDEGRSQDSSKTHIRYAVRQKRADTKSALKNLLFNGKPVQSIHDQTQRQRKLKARHLNDTKEKRRKKRECTGEREGYFTWTWAGETFTFANSCPNGFEWRDDSNWHQNQHKKFWNDSDVEDESEERSNVTNLMIHRTTLGLPHTGLLKLDHIKSAFRSAALKWHPDKHEGSSKAIAEEKFKLCVDAYKALSLSLTQQG